MMHASAGKAMRNSPAPPVAPACPVRPPNFAYKSRIGRASRTVETRHAGIAMLALVLPLMLLIVAVRRGTGVLAAILLLMVFVASV